MDTNITQKQTTKSDGINVISKSYDTTCTVIAKICLIHGFCTILSLVSSVFVTANSSYIINIVRLCILVVMYTMITCTIFLEIKKSNPYTITEKTLLEWIICLNIFIPIFVDAVRLFLFYFEESNSIIKTDRIEQIKSSLNEFYAAAAAIFFIFSVLYFINMIKSRMIKCMIIIMVCTSLLAPIFFHDAYIPFSDNLHINIVNWSSSITNSILSIMIGTFLLKNHNCSSGSIQKYA